MSQRRKTVPPTRVSSRSPRSGRSGLIAREKTKKQSAKRRTALDNRFHRTPTLSCTRASRARPYRGALAAATDGASEGARCGQREAEQWVSPGPGNGPRVSSSGELGGLLQGRHQTKVRVLLFHPSQVALTTIALLGRGALDCANDTGDFSFVVCSACHSNLEAGDGICYILIAERFGAFDDTSHDSQQLANLASARRT
jgi:hypothetical protein